MITHKRLIGALTVLLVAMSVAVICFSLTARGQGQTASEADDWEYLIVAGGNVSLSPMGSSPGERKQKAFNDEAVTAERNLDKLGKDGWMLVAVSGSQGGTTFFLKRPARAK